MERVSGRGECWRDVDGLVTVGGRGEKRSGRGWPRRVAGTVAEAAWGRLLARLRLVADMFNVGQ